MLLPAFLPLDVKQLYVLQVGFFSLFREVRRGGGISDRCSLTGVRQGYFRVDLVNRSDFFDVVSGFCILRSIAASVKML